MVTNSASVLEVLERLAPGTPIRNGLERIIQAGKGALIVLGSGRDVDEISSGGFLLNGSAFSPARLHELAKMDGGIVLDLDSGMLTAANVHFVPSADIPTDETGSRHRTAQRIALQTGRPVVAVSEGRHIATLYIDGQKIELPRPTAVAERVNQELQTLDRLRRQLAEAEQLLTLQEVNGAASYRAVASVLQRSELIRRVGAGIERYTISMGDEGNLASVQLQDLRQGVENLLDLTLRDYVPTRRPKDLNDAMKALESLSESELSDPSEVCRTLGFADLESEASPRGYRLLDKAGRMPESVRDELVRQFKSLDKMLHASKEELETIEGIGVARAAQLRHYFDRLVAFSDQ